MHGFGDFIWASGKSFSGQYVKDKKEGLGLYYWNDPTEIFFGYWNKGQREGPAIQINKDGKQYTFWDAGKQIKEFSNKQEGINYCQSVSNMNRKYKKFYQLPLEDLVRVYTKRKYISLEE